MDNEEVENQSVLAFRGKQQRKLALALKKRQLVAQLMRDTNDNKKKLRRFPLNVRAVSAKIKLPKIYLQHCHILRTDKKNLSLLLLPS